MSKDIVTLSPTQTLYEAEALFKKHHIRHIPVVEGRKLIGVLSLTDLLRISFADLSDDEKHVDSVVYDMFTIPQVMAKVPLAISPDTTIKEAAEILAEQTMHFPLLIMATWWACLPLQTLSSIFWNNIN